LGTDTLYKKIHLLAYSLFQASHIAYEYVYDGESDFKSDSPVEIGTIRRIPGIQDILNPEFFLEMMENDDEFESEYDGKSIIESAKNMPEDQTFLFKCECHEPILVPEGNWPFVICPNCNNKIFRKEVREIGGIYFYEKASNNKK